jgi:hypothetical protein
MPVAGISGRECDDTSSPSISAFGSRGCRFPCRVSVRSHVAGELFKMMTGVNMVATTPIFFTPAEFGAYMAAETEKWGKVVRTAGVRPE